MPPRRKKSHGWVVLIWGINGLVFLGLLVLGAFYFSPTDLRVSAAVDSTGTPHPVETRKIPPTSYFLPTLTPNPYYTPPVFESPTPFALAYGPRPSIIGFSVAGRPIEAYTFGNGEKQCLIVAGIHGGYEGNTIAARSGVKLIAISLGTAQSLIELQAQVVTSALDDAAAQLERAARAESPLELVRDQAELLRATRDRIVSDITQGVAIFKDAGGDVRKVAAHTLGAVKGTAKAKPAAAKAKRARTTARPARKTAAKKK